MLIYFGKDGTLKEIVSSYTLSNGDSAYKNIQGSSSNVIYCYYEGRDTDFITTSNCHITYYKDGSVVTPADANADEALTASIDYDRNQDLRYFEYEKEYKFAKFSVPSNVLATDGLVMATSRVVIDTYTYAYGKITFNVSSSVVLEDSYITQSQYDYLLYLVTNGSIEAGNGLTKTGNIIKVDWTLVASKEEMPNGFTFADNAFYLAKSDGTAIDTSYSLGLGNGFNVVKYGTKYYLSLTDDVLQSYQLIKDHLADTDNPHKVTKAQIGLGDVVNGGLDTTPTASSNNYVTSGGVKAYVDSAIGSVSGFSYVIVDALPSASSSTMNRIYLVADKHSDTGDNYDEYITLENDGAYSWEKIGNTDIDLSGYVPNSRTVNGKALSADVILSASDVGVSATSDGSGNLSSLSVNGTSYAVKGSVEVSFLDE